MKKPIAVVGAASSIGIRPYQHGAQRKLDQTASVLRTEGLVERLDARDLGDVVAPPYRDYMRPASRPRNEESLVSYSRDLARRVATASEDGAFVVVVGGDCSVVLGSLLGIRATTEEPVALAYIDGHADFASPRESITGSAASMCLAMAVGRGDTPLARLRDDGPLVSPEHVALVGRRDHDQMWYGHKALRKSAILDLACDEVHRRGSSATAALCLERLAIPRGGFWIHVDADILDPSELAAVDSPEPNGLTIEQLTDLLRPLVEHPHARGMELTIYDPELDPNRDGARRLTAMLEEVLAPAEVAMAL
jgi:arginase